MRARFSCRAAGFDAAELAAKARSAEGRALAQAGEFVRARSADLAPRRSGNLIASARVVGEGDRVEVRYTAPYAAIQHERTDFRHPNGGRAKYLCAAAEDPATARELERILAAQLRSEL